MANDHGLNGYIFRRSPQVSENDGGTTRTSDTCRGGNEGSPTSTPKAVGDSGDNVISSAVNEQENGSAYNELGLGGAPSSPPSLFTCSRNER
eukprot:scaffold766_cov210-Alexandrium_tamarense.AAC.16